MRFLKNLIISIFSIVCFVSFLYAGGTSGADFLNIGPGVRSSGLGDAFTAVADETSGVFYNAAGPGFAFSPEIQTMYTLWVGDLYYSYLGYSYPTLHGTYGAGLQYLSGPSAPKFVDGTRMDTFNFSNGAANLSYSFLLSETGAMGINLKGIQSVVDSNSEQTLTGDFGILFRTPEEGFSFGMSGQNLFGKIGNDRLPLTMRMGMAFKANLPEHFSEVLFALEAGQTQPGYAYYSAGIEHWGAGTLGLRIGYKYIADEKQRSSMDVLAPWRAGISLRLKNGAAFDYAYQPFAALGTAHRISFTWRMLGWQSKWRMVSCQIKADPSIFSPNGDGAKDNIFLIPQVTEIKDVRNWELVIEDVNHVPVKKIGGKDVIPKILSWEGQNETGQNVQEGKYPYYFVAEGDGRKRAKSETGEITADLTPPAASIQVSNETLSPLSTELNNTTTFFVSVSDAYGIDQWRLNVVNDMKKTVKVFRSTESFPTEIIWDGRDDYYGAAVPNGDYEAQLVVWDLAGNKSKASAGLKIYTPPKIEVKEVVKEVVREIKVKEEKRGLVVNLSSQVMFEVGKSTLRKEAFRSLDQVVNLLETYPENEVVIEGHTDSIGSKSKNVELSSARAWAVYSYLVKKGISPSRLKPKGMGPDKPIALNRTASERSQNRRVEIIILKKE